MILVDQYGTPVDWVASYGLLRPVQVFVTRTASGELVEVGVVDTVSPAPTTPGQLQTLMSQS